MVKIYAHLTNFKKDKVNLGDMMGYILAEWIMGPNYKKLGIRDIGEIDSETFAIVGSLIGAVANTPVTVLGGGLINDNRRRYSSEIKIIGQKVWTLLTKVPKF